MTLGYTSKKYSYLLCTLLNVIFFQATAEQIRLAQMIYDKNDADFEDKVKQVRFLQYRFFCPIIKCSRAGLHFGARASVSGLDETFFRRA